MKRYISNYTILSNGKEFINHITTINDNGSLLSIEPFDRELGNTHYVPTPLCIATANVYDKIKRAFLACGSREQFKQHLKSDKCKKIEIGEAVIILNLDFPNKTINEL